MTMIMKRLSLLVLLFGVVIALWTTGCGSGAQDAEQHKTGDGNEPAEVTITPGSYILRFPWPSATARDFESTIREYEVRIVEQDDQVLLLQTDEPLWKWVHVPEGLDKPREHKGWPLKRGEKGRVSFGGYLSSGEGIARIQMHGQSIGKSQWKGEGFYTVGAGPGSDPGVFTWKHHFQWSLTPKGEGVPELSRKVTFEGRVPKHVPVKVYSQDEMAEFKRLRGLSPPVSAAGIKSLSTMPQRLRQQGAERSRSIREYLETKVLNEIDWEEIRVIPGIILSVDFLAGVDIRDQKHVATVSIMDGSEAYLKDYSYADMRDIPPAFVLVHCYPELSEVAKTKIKKGSARFALILEETEKHKDAPVDALDEIMAAVLTRMSAEDRANYFRTSAKLKPYVAASKHEALRALLPKQAE